MLEATNTLGSANLSLPNLSNPLGLSPSALTEALGRSSASVSAEGIVSLNRKVSFTGDRSLLQDDAFLYAGRGVNFNQAPDFSLKLDGSGLPVRDSAGLLTYRDGAFAIGSGYTMLNRPNSPYTPRLTIVDPRTVQVPSFDTLRQDVFEEKVPAGGVFTQVDSGQSPINSVVDWRRLFVDGSATAPTLVRVVGGGLNIPDGAMLKNAVVIVESGDINFNGRSPSLENVVLIAERGNVNLGTVQAKDLAVLASGAIHMNSEARFSGRTLIANAADRAIAFNGSMASNGASDFLTVVSQGQLFFNATSDTRGVLLSRGDVSFNSGAELLGAIQTKGNLTFNGAGSVRGLSVDVTPMPTPDPIPNPIPDPVPVNRSPIITTTPTLQSLIGNLYQYDVDATDADGDRLTYSLLSSPVGMAIDGATGVIRWNTVGQIAGSYETEVQVSDGRGGVTQQRFRIGLTAPVVEPEVRTGEIRGVVWDDMNRNGVIDSNLIRGQNPDIVFAIDVSGSSSTEFNGTPVGDLNRDGRENRILDGEIAGIRALRQLLVNQGYGDRTRVSLISFKGDAVNIDMNPQAAGVQISTSLTADANSNGISDLEEALISLRSGGGTDFEAALQQVESTFQSLNTAPGNGNLIFLTDGRDTGRLTDEVDRLNRNGVNISAFGAGAGARLDNLRVIDPDAQVFQSTDELLALFGGVQSGPSQSTLEKGIANVRVYLDLNNNGRLDVDEPTQLTNSAGEYRFTGVRAGSYQVRHVVPTNYQPTFPLASGAYQVTLVGDDVVIDRNFGDAIVG